jgi:hypothetical protein
MQFFDWKIQRWLVANIERRFPAMPKKVAS